MKIKILNSAIEDLINGYKFYERLGHGLGSYFIDSLFSDIDSLQLFAGVHQKCFGDYHRMLSRRFPYSIYYKTENDIVTVYAVLDCRQNPEKIKRKLIKS